MKLEKRMMNYSMVVQSSGKMLTDLVKEANSDKTQPTQVNGHKVHSVQYNEADKQKLVELQKQAKQSV